MAVLGFCRFSSKKFRSSTLTSAHCVKVKDEELLSVVQLNMSLETLLDTELTAENRKIYRPWCIAAD